MYGIERNATLPKRRPSALNQCFVIFTRTMACCEISDSDLLFSVFRNHAFLTRADLFHPLDLQQACVRNVSVEIRQSM